MTEHVTQWIEAYYDGELQGHQMQQVEAHLATCETCLAELENLNSLSALLQEYPEARDLKPVATFTSQVSLRLPRRPKENQRQKTLRTGWRWIPAALLTAWVFVQTTFIVSGIINWTLRFIPDAGQFADFLQNDSQAESIFEAASQLTGTSFSEFGRFGLDFLGNGGPLGWAITLNLGLSLLIGLLYLSWLASWWVQESTGNEKSTKL